jgi:hypothetical protein
MIYDERTILHKMNTRLSCDYRAFYLMLIIKKNIKKYE